MRRRLVQEDKALAAQQSQLVEREDRPGGSD